MAKSSSSSSKLFETPIEKNFVKGPSDAPTKVYPGSSKLGRSDMGKGSGNSTVEGPAGCGGDKCVGGIQKKP